MLSWIIGSPPGHSTALGAIALGQRLSKIYDDKSEMDRIMRMLWNLIFTLKFINQEIESALYTPKNHTL